MRTRKHSRLESSWLGKFIEDGAGTAAAKFALVLIPMVAILFGIMMMGSLFFIHNDMMNAAREAARRMSVDETVTFDEGVTVACDGNLVAGSVPEVACNALASWPVTFQVRASTIPIAGTDNSEKRVTITTDMGSSALIDLLGAANGKTMTADVIMRGDFPAS